MSKTYSVNLTLFKKFPVKHHWQLWPKKYGTNNIRFFIENIFIKNVVIFEALLQKLAYFFNHEFGGFVCHLCRNLINLILGLQNMSNFYLNAIK